MHQLEIKCLRKKSNSLIEIIIIKHTNTGIKIKNNWAVKKIKWKITIFDK